MSALASFCARRPFHPQRLHAALDILLDGVVRTRGRAWLANRFDDVMWIESAGGGLRSSYAGRWLAAMDPKQLAYVDPQRRALAAETGTTAWATATCRYPYWCAGRNPKTSSTGCGARCSPITSWRARTNGHVMPIRSAEAG